MITFIYQDYGRLTCLKAKVFFLELHSRGRQEEGDRDGWSRDGRVIASDGIEREGEEEMKMENELRVS